MKKYCYQCYASVNWLAPDGRCAKCTRMTPDEVGGYTDLEIKCVCGEITVHHMTPLEAHKAISATCGYCGRSGRLNSNNDADVVLDAMDAVAQAIGPY